MAFTQKNVQRNVNFVEMREAKDEKNLDVPVSSRHFLTFFFAFFRKTFIKISSFFPRFAFNGPWEISSKKLVSLRWG
jgi:hypothetical protein